MYSQDDLLTAESCWAPVLNLFQRRKALRSVWVNSTEALLLGFFSPQTVQQQEFQSISLSWSNQLLTETDNNIFVEVTRLFRQRMIYNLELYLKYSVRLPIRLMKHHQDKVVEGE